MLFAFTRNCCRSLKRVLYNVPLVLLIITCPLCTVQSSAADAPSAKVLYINSYHRGYSWSDGIEQGLRDELNASGKKIEISVEYLDSRRFAYGAQIEPLASSMAAKYAHYRPDLVIVSDNAAFDFALQHRARLFPGIPLVFCGYNNFRPDVLKGITNSTGVNEEISVDDTVAMALKVHPQSDTLVFILSTADINSKRITTVTEQEVLPELRKRFDVQVLKDASVWDIRTRLAKLPHNTLVFLSGQVRDQGEGRALSPLENASLITAVSPFPVYGFWDFQLNRGIIGGHILTGADQGRAAAGLALKVLNGRPADSIPVIMTSPTSDIFDYKLMERFGIHPADLPANATIINRPISLWHSYRWQIVGVAVLLITETVLVALLLHISRGRRIALGELARERETLEQRVVERTAELESANEQLVRFSFQDSLTGLANRRRFDEMLELEFQRHARSGAELSLILLDVDFFKPYNDHYGHLQGDECLRRIADTLGSSILRPSDLAVRYGGEEFAVILPETGHSGALQVAERIRMAIAELAVPHAWSEVAPYVTISLGAMTMHCSQGEQPEQLLEQTDRLLYEAKRTGRNRVVSGELPCPAQQVGMPLVQFVWSDALCSGNRLIDSQHQELIKLANRFFEAIQAGRPESEIRTVVARLLDEVQQHFNDEEQILRKAGYPGLEQHAQEHARLLAYRQTLADACACNRFSPQGTCSFLIEDLVMQHLLNEDRRFFGFLKNVPNDRCATLPGE